MKNLNIYTWRELSKMYIDGRPMPDVVFVTQTDAMKLQSMPKEENEGWITDRLPTREDGSNGHLVYDYRGEPAMYYNIRVGEAWKPIPKCDPYVKPKKPKRFEVIGVLDVYMIYDNELLTYVSMMIPTREAAERIASIYEEMSDDERSES